MSLVHASLTQQVNARTGTARTSPFRDLQDIEQVADKRATDRGHEPHRSPPIMNDCSIYQRKKSGCGCKFHGVRALWHIIEAPGPKFLRMWQLRHHDRVPNLCAIWHTDTTQRNVATGADSRCGYFQ